jgi:hypothetical protein
MAKCWKRGITIAVRITNRKLGEWGHLVNLTHHAHLADVR